MSRSDSRMVLISGQDFGSEQRNAKKRQGKDANREGTPADGFQVSTCIPVTRF